VHLGGGAQNHRIHFGQRQTVSQLGGDVGDAVLGGDLAGFVEFATDQGDDLNTFDVFDAVEVFDAEGTGTCQGYFDGLHAFSIRDWMDGWMVVVVCGGRCAVVRQTPSVPGCGWVEMAG